MSSRAIVLDANILIRAVLGSKVSELLAAHAERISFLAPDTAFDEAREHLPLVLLKRGMSREAIAAALEKLDVLATIIWPVPVSAYAPLQAAAVARIGARDEDDWPVLACALAAKCPIWTEDGDFFGTGVATWTTGRVNLYFTLPDSMLGEH